MAAGRLPTPGSEAGPCVPTCEHRDCAANRRDAATICGWCNEKIGYDRRFYRQGAGAEPYTTMVHADCEEREIARTRHASAQAERR